MAPEFIAALKRTEQAAWDYSLASRNAAKANCWAEFDKNASGLRAAQTEQVGRVTVTAGAGGNSRRMHVRHTFKIDGKRATRAQAEEVLS